MNDKNKAIEEMARVNCQIAKYKKISCVGCVVNKPCEWFKEAEALYNAGYNQPINDDEVVINKEEYEKLKKHYLFMQDYTIVEVLEKECEKASKETAREILQKISEKPCKSRALVCDFKWFKKICEEYGVEVE